MKARMCIGMFWLGAVACAPKPSGTCVATARPQLRTEHGASLDLDDPVAVEAAAGRPVLLCTELRTKTSGRVVNPLTGEGVAGAQLIVESWRASPPLLGSHWLLLDRVRTRTFVTKADGAFDIEPEAAWLPGILATEGLPVIVQRTCITAPGFEPLVYEPSVDADSAELPARFELRPSTDSSWAATVPCNP